MCSEEKVVNHWRKTFLGRVVRGVWMLRHRSDTSQGHLHPPLAISLDFFLFHSLGFLSYPESYHTRGLSHFFFLRDAYAATFHKCACAITFFFFYPFASLFSLPKATAIVYASIFNPTTTIRIVSEAYSVYTFGIRIPWIGGILLLCFIHYDNVGFGKKNLQFAS